MQMISQQTSMTSFSVILVLTTISTVSGVFVLTGAFQRMQNNIGTSTRNFACKHSSIANNKIWNNMLEESRTRRAERYDQILGNIRTGASGSLWKYACFITEICFVAIPVVEINSALRLYGFLDRLESAATSPQDTPPQSHAFAKTPATDGEADVRNVTDLQSRARQVIEARLARVDASRSSNSNSWMFNVVEALLIGVRVLMLPIWIPLVLMEYAVLFCMLPLVGHEKPVEARPMSRSQPPRKPTLREKVTQLFTAPLVFMGFNIMSIKVQEQQHYDPENPLTPPQTALSMELYELSPSISGHTMVENTPPANFKQGSQRWRNLLTQPSFQRYQEEQPGRSGTATPSTEGLSSVGTQRRKRGHSDLGIAY